MLYNTRLKGIILTQTSTEKDHSISPYTYVSELYAEQMDDEALYVIKNMCLEYLRSSDVEFKKTHTVTQVTLSYEFIIRKTEDLRKIRKTFSLDSGSTPFTSIGHSMDLITVSSEVKGYNNRSLYYELATHLDLTLEILKYCEHVLRKILHKEGKQR